MPSSGIIIRVSGVRVPPPALNPADSCPAGPVLPQHFSFLALVFREGLSKARPHKRSALNHPGHAPRLGNVLRPFHGVRKILELPLPLAVKRNPVGGHGEERTAATGAYSDSPAASRAFSLSP